MHDAPTLELVIADGTGAISVVFLGRRSLAGVKVDTTLVVEGTVGVHKTAPGDRQPLVPHPRLKQALRPTS